MTVEDKDYIKANEELFSEDHTSVWTYGDEVLYNMCRERPNHDIPEISVSKVWLIGRSYSAAIDRYGKEVYNGKDFYTDKVLPMMEKIGKDLDEKLNALRGNGTITEGLSSILSVHKYLVDQFAEITQQDKRSLVSKYLHFHCPDKFYIYDSRACGAVKELIEKYDKKLLTGCGYYDTEYASFVCRTIELTEIIEGVIGKQVTPRQVDNFLLFYDADHLWRHQELEDHHLEEK